MLVVGGALGLAAALAVPYKLSPHLANDIVKHMLKQMPGLVQQQGQRVIGRMPGMVLPIVVDDNSTAAAEEGEEGEEGELLVDDVSTRSDHADAAEFAEVEG